MMTLSNTNHRYHIFFSQLIFSLLNIIWVANYAFAQEEVLRIGVENDYPPFAFMEDNELKGFDVELANALCETANKRCEIISMPFNQLFDALLKEKRIDAIIDSINITEERRKTMLFTKPYYVPTARFLRSNETFIPFQAGALENKKIGVEAGTTYERYLRESFAEHLDVHAYPSLHEATDAMKAGKIDAIIADELTLELNYTKKDSSVSFWGPSLRLTAITKEGAGIPLRLEDTHLVTILNDALSAVKLSGRFSQISKKYFRRNIAR